MNDLLNKILQRNVLDMPWPIPDNSIDCCVTSPPYWALRNYGVDGQIGMEETPDLFIQALVKVFEEVRRVLKPDGTLWVNIGDTYYGGKGSNGASKAYTNYDNTLNKKALIVTTPGDIRPNDRRIEGLKQKDLVGIPWMLAFALRSAGWYLRQDIIWNKPNPMPESAQDRCTKAHEYIFLLSKSKTYYYDAYSIATPYKDKTYTTFGIESKGYGDGTGLIQSENWAASIKERKPKKWKTPDGWDTGEGGHGSIHRNGREKGRKPRPRIDDKGGNQGKGNIPMGINGKGFSGHSGYYDSDGNIIGNGRANKRSVWTVATSPMKEAHFATFPEALITPCILAGCPKNGIVLDPFMGAGTTALVAMSHGRKFIGMELNPEYIKIANKRLKDKFGMFYHP